MISSPILIFLDLDDTLFQTRRKNPNATFPATRSPNPDNQSFMDNAQSAFFDWLKISPQQVQIIPVTARDWRQFGNTFLFNDARIATAVLYFGGEIRQKKQIDMEWQQHIQHELAKLSLSVAELHQKIKDVLQADEQFSVYNVGDYYVAIKALTGCSQARQTEVFAQLHTLLPADYHWHHNGRAVSLYPQCIDKAAAVRFLISRFRPALTLGFGDSLSDLGFMRCCDFWATPANSQINQSVTIHDPEKPL